MDPETSGNTMIISYVSADGMSFMIICRDSVAAGHCRRNIKKKLCKEDNNDGGGSRRNR